VLPFLSQSDYDRLLWISDLNFVRGEDSFVRAQWARRPFIWHIYPQEENAHWPKLEAFLQRYVADPQLTPAADFWRCWNGRGDIAAAWTELSSILPAFRNHAGIWAGQLAKCTDLASNLVQFSNELL
ncbi:MAG TPA: elongation factor P maturation arginine rhamnosyltransferase EarP, partial [Rhodocyclaceae bacterium]|nr:elongation factor P maturation arginine rhamnosyltransferase EarP [Rhodocyclaceae bacterium]